MRLPQPVECHVRYHVWTLKLATGAKTNERGMSCCLCLRPLLDASTVKKQKLLYNESCKRSREVLNEVLLSKLKLSLDAFKETRDPYAYLCHFCDAQTAKIVKHRTELQLTEEQVVEKVSHLTRLGSSSETPNDRARRRPSTDGHNSRGKDHDQNLFKWKMNHRSLKALIIMKGIM